MNMDVLVSDLNLDIFHILFSKFLSYQEICCINGSKKCILLLPRIAEVIARNVTLFDQVYVSVSGSYVTLFHPINNFRTFQKKKKKSFCTSKLNSIDIALSGEKNHISSLLILLHSFCLPSQINMLKLLLIFNFKILSTIFFLIFGWKSSSIKTFILLTCF